MATKAQGPLVGTQSSSDDLIDAGRSVLLQEARAIAMVADHLDASFPAAVRLIHATTGRLIITGVGKSGHVGRKMAATFSATGTPAMFLHAGEAAHGDLGIIGSGDTVLVLSNSGGTPELRPVLSHARRQDLRLIGMTSRVPSPVADQSDVVLQLPRVAEACPVKVAPTTSTSMAMALGDALALAVMQMRGLTKLDLLQWHPGGNIGFLLSPIDGVLDRAQPLPLVRRDARMRDIILEMTSVGRGVTGVVDRNGNLIGIITDGDLRRSFDHIQSSCADDIMTRTPITVPSGTSVEDVIILMNQAKITTIFVTERHDERRPIGLVHIHDLALGG